ncbi:MAG TPA: MupA/Atu3671 family FMN-dependent luciferase-like monooxygenase [Pyrinomonadaceae bacterium]|nr:MupA/Atu3671 family FMN-dependent luciferase-like monooxygenase [Pyrinomonadaceae bacterium]
MNRSSSSLVELLRGRALHQPDRLAYTFLAGGDVAETHLTYGELDRRARAIAAQLQARGMEGQRVLLLYPAGLEYIAAFFGCLYAGAVAVPTYPPRLNRNLLRLQSIVADAGAAMALATESLLSRVGPLLEQSPELQRLPWLATDNLAGNLSEEWRELAANGDTLAFLQYTSGSTAAPKGVMVSHGNLLHNERLIQKVFRQTEEAVIVGWLPLYHDMGLIGNVIQPLYLGARCILISPVAFLQQPFRWLQLISEYRATTSGGPNFAYDLCVRKITPEERASLDLSSWSVAFNGSEPVRADTLERFATTFASCGFRREAFHPCYGLAEATLLVSGRDGANLPIVNHGGALPPRENGTGGEAADATRSRSALVACGGALPEQKVLVVDPESRVECQPGEVGEVWVNGPSIAQGYWNRPEETEHTFRARLADTGEGPFLRTGDLGFLQDGELFIAGRLKDLIIIRGRNHYPQDIERTVELCHPTLRPGCGAAFSIDEAGEERLVIVQELDRREQSDARPVIEAIRQKVAEEHEVQVSSVVLVKPGSIPKTTSGKIQRRASREAFLGGELKISAEWREDVSARTQEAPHTDPAISFDSRETVESWLRAQVAARAGVRAEMVDVNRPFTEYGLDSLMAIELMHSIETRLGVCISLTDFLQGSSIAQIAEQSMTHREDAARENVAGLSAAREAATEFPLSHGQQALWYLYQLAPESTAYNISAAVRIKGGLKPDKLRRAFQMLVARHPSLRTSFSAPLKEPLQKVHQSVGLSFEIEDAANRDDAALQERLVEEAHRPFKLEQGALLRVSVFTRPAGEHVLLLSVHHIIADFWSLAVLIQELGALYEAEESGVRAELPPLSLQYADYVRWQERVLSGSVGEKSWKYWEKQLSGELPVLNLPADRPRPPVQTFRGASQPFKLSRELTGRLKALGTARGATLYMTLLAAFETLLYRYSGQEEIIVGSPVAGRSRAELAGLVGYFVNPIALRANLSANPTFESFLDQVRQTVLGAFEHQDYPFPLLVEKLHPHRDASRSPIFQAMFILQRAHLFDLEGLASFALGETGAHMKLGELALESMALEQRVAQFDLTLMMAEVDGALGASLQYNSELFAPATIRRMAQHFETLLESIAAAPAQTVSTLSLLPEAERHQLLRDWNDTNAVYPAHQCIHRLFEAQVERTPDAVALTCENEQVTYAELNRRANRLARFIQELGVEPEALVGILMERSVEMMVALLGTLKAGGAYVPLDPSYPAQRLAFMLENAGVKVLLTQQRLAAGTEGVAARVVCVDTDWNDIAVRGAENLENSTSAGNLAYVIYTSGSTGEPKGVMVGHRNVVNFFTAMDERIGSRAGGATWLAVTSISFDISVLELFWTITRGFNVVLQREPERSVLAATPTVRRTNREMAFSLFYFASDDDEASADKYRLLIEGAKFADRHGFAAVWTPERHFHAFGGLYPNPSVTGAALATITEHIQIRAGSVVMPLHSPIRVAEEWSVVDNLSKGRVGVSFASGWHADDFVFAPHEYARRKEAMLSGIEIVRKLWRGEAVTFQGGAGNDVEVKICPRPVQHELPFWITAAGSPETFQMAGESGANLLTHLLGQSLEELSEKIEIYRRAWREHHPQQGEGRVSLMLHTFVGADAASVREKVRQPFINYLRSSFGLIKNLARSLGQDIEGENFTEDDMQALLSHAFDRYFETSGLFGTPDGCLRIVERLKAIGVDEVACLVDFGVDFESVMSSLDYLSAVKEQSNRNGDAPEEDYSLPAQLQRHSVSHLQCTPSMASMLAAEPGTLSALRSVRQLLLGGEALPAALAAHLSAELAAEIHNMYGPTETTIWSATHLLSKHGGSVPIGRPVANTQIYILDRQLQPVPVNVPGELFIGGAGVVRGYLKRPDLTAARFVPDPFGSDGGGRLYRTGDLARYLPGGDIEFLGRMDDQVKVRGHRIELGEIETAIVQHAGVREAVVVAREDTPGDKRLVAYLVPAQGRAQQSREQPLTPVDPERILADRRGYRLANGMIVAHHSGLQTNIIYREVFEDKVYLQHGITLNDGDCVFDVGANIGLFTLFAHQQCKNPVVYAFEPIPPTFDLLSTNVALYGLDVKLFNCGLSGETKMSPFTFYPHAAGLSGYVSGADEDKQVTKSIIGSWLQKVAPENKGAVLPQAELDALIDEQLQSETYVCQLRTLSEIIRENNVARVDLLKIDVEGSEYNVLAGLDEADWEKIRQIVIEVHTEELLERITVLLERHGFNLSVDETILVEETDGGAATFVYTLYAIHSAPDKAPAETQDVAAGAASITSLPAALSLGELRDALKAKLPDFMIPSAFVLMDALPLTPNGKVNRRALPQPDARQAERRTIVDLPRTATEKALAEVWMEVLGSAEVGIYDDFFESGGHSLTATQFVSRVHSLFAVDLTLRSFLKSPTISSLAQMVEESLIAKSSPDKIDELLDLLETLDEDELETSTEDALIPDSGGHKNRLA